MNRSLHRIVRCASVGLLTVALVPVAWAGNKDPAFEVPREEIVARIKTIGVMPMITPSDLPNRADVERRYEAEVVTRLERAGFAVVKPDVMRVIRDRLRQSLGGLYNPLDGKPIEEKVKAFQEYSRSEYQTRNVVDGTLRIDIRERTADTESSRADWDGVREDIGGSGFTALMTNTQVKGSTPALSFVVRLFDKADKLLYAKAGGLQVLRYVTGGQFGAFKQSRVDPEFLLTDPARDLRAWSIALDPLLAADTMPRDAKYPHAPATADAQAAAPQSLSAFINRYTEVLLVPVELEMAT